MDHGKKVWAPDLRDGFILGEISDFGTDTIDVQPLNGGKVIAAPYDAVYPAEEDDNKDAEDNCALNATPRRRAPRPPRPRGGQPWFAWAGVGPVHLARLSGCPAAP